MSRGLMMALLALDLLLMAASGYIIFDRVRVHWQEAASAALPVRSAPAPAPVQPAAPAAPPVQPAPAVSNAPAAGAKAQVQAPAASQEAPARRVLFKYRDSVPQRVSIVGDFNGWSPRLMKKDKNGNWTAVYRLKPGEYAYNFVVDGKMIRDPANRRMKQAGQKIPSSVLIIKS